MHVDWLRQEIIFKIVYYGPGLGGKTTNLKHLHAHLDPAVRSELIVLKTSDERTLYFDFLQLELGRLKGKKPRFHIYTVPGQARYAYGRSIIIRDSDAVVFVADSQRARMDDNLSSMLDLEIKLNRQQRTLGEFPWVMQYNKRDLPNIENLSTLQRRLNFLNAPWYEAVATSGLGVFETLRGAIQLLISKI